MQTAWISCNTLRAKLVSLPRIADQTENRHQFFFVPNHSRSLSYRQQIRYMFSIPIYHGNLFDATSPIPSFSFTCIISTGSLCHSPSTQAPMQSKCQLQQLRCYTKLQLRPNGVAKTKQEANISQQEYRFQNFTHSPLENLTGLPIARKITQSNRDCSFKSHTDTQGNFLAPITKSILSVLFNTFQQLLICSQGVFHEPLHGLKTTQQTHLQTTRFASVALINRMSA